MGESLSCERCGDVIGAYEPLIVFGTSGARVMSRALARAVAGESDRLFHAHCFEHRDATAREGRTVPPAPPGGAS